MAAERDHAGLGATKPGARHRLRLLMLCYHFPPMGTTGALRPARLVRYLPADVAVDVITVRDPPEADRNTRLMTEIAGRFERIEAPLRPNPLQRWLETELAAAAEGSWRCKAWKTAATWMTWIPDRQVGFVSGAVAAGSALLQCRRPDVLLCSSPPHSLHLAGVELKRRSGVPLVVDFRDPWGDCYLRLWPSALHRAYERRLEARVLRTADLVIANTRSQATQLRRRFPSLPSERLVVLPNGFDPARRAEQATARGAVRADGRREVLYTGHVYGSSAGTMEALAVLLALDPALPRRVVFRFVGSMDPPVAARSEALQAAGLLERSPAVPVDQVPALMAGADALLYLVPPAAQRYVPSKLYDYLTTGKPILAILPRGEAWQILQRSGVGSLIEDLGPRRVAAELRRSLERLLSGTLTLRADEDYIATFDARRQAAQLAAWLRRFAPGEPPLSGGIEP
jgi:hypothetical protein